MVTWVMTNSQFSKWLDELVELMKECSSKMPTGARMRACNRYSLITRQRKVLWPPVVQALFGSYEISNIQNNILQSWFTYYWMLGLGIWAQVSMLTTSNPEIQTIVMLNQMKTGRGVYSSMSRPCLQNHLFLVAIALKWSDVQSTLELYSTLCSNAIWKRSNCSYRSALMLALKEACSVAMQKGRLNSESIRAMWQAGCVTNWSAMPEHEVGISLSMGVLCSITAMAVLLRTAYICGRSFHAGGSVNAIGLHSRSWARIHGVLHDNWYQFLLTSEMRSPRCLGRSHQVCSSRALSWEEDANCMQISRALRSQCYFQDSLPWVVFVSCMLLFRLDLLAFSSLASLVTVPMSIATALLSSPGPCSLILHPCAL